MAGQGSGGADQDLSEFHNRTCQRAKKIVIGASQKSCLSSLSEGHGCHWLGWWCGGTGRLDFSCEGKAETSCNHSVCSEMGYVIHRCTLISPEITIYQYSVLISYIVVHLGQHTHWFQELDSEFRTGECLEVEFEDTCGHADLFGKHAYMMYSWC